MFEFRLQYITIKIRAEKLVSALPPPPSHLLCSFLTLLVLDLQSICQGCLSAIHAPGIRSASNGYQLVPSERCPQVLLDMLTSGELKLMPYVGEALPRRPEKGLSCVCNTWSILNGISDQFRGEGERKNTLDMEEECVLPSAAPYPGLEQLPPRAMASVVL